MQGGGVVNNSLSVVDGSNNIKSKVNPNTPLLEINLPVKANNGFIYNKNGVDEQTTLLVANISQKLSISDFNSTLTSQLYTKTASDARFQRALTFNAETTDSAPVIHEMTRKVKKYRSYVAVRNVVY